VADWTGSGAAADARPEVNDSGIEELIERVKSYQARRCILETQPKGRRKWQGKRGSDRRCIRSGGGAGWWNAALPTVTTWAA